MKGDGSPHCGGIELIDRDDFSLRFSYCFPIDSTDWRKITVRWSDLTPELTGPLIDPADGGYAPSHFGNFWFGGNDWETGVRGERFAEYLRLAVVRIRQQTGGHSDILLMTPCPSFARFETMRELERAVTDVGRETRVAVVDIAAAFRAPGSADAAMAKDYWAWDKTHLGTKGHEVVVDALVGVLDPSPQH